MGVLQNGGRAEVDGSYLVVSRPAKFDDEGRHVPVKDEEVTVRIKLDDIKDITFVRATRLGEPGAVTVRLEGRTLLLSMLEADGLRLVEEARRWPPVRHLSDADSGSASDNDK